MDVLIIRNLHRCSNGITKYLSFNRWKPSKKLKYLESNLLINRKPYEMFPPTVEYYITKHGMSSTFIERTQLLGIKHGEEVIKK